MFPQIVQSDSAKKSSDKLPFAPFLNPETVNQKKESSPKQSTQPQQKKKVEKSASQTTIAPQKSVTKTIQQTVTAKPAQQNTASPSITTTVAKPIQQTVQQPQQNQPDTTSILQQVAITPSDALLSDTALSQQAASDSFSFRFSDEDAPSTTFKNQTQYSGSSKYFSSHLLQNNSEYPNIFIPRVPDWFTVFFILIICGITTIKIFYNKIFKQLFDAFYSLAVANQVVRDENILVQRASVLLNIIFYGIAALFLYFISVKYNWNNPFFNHGIFRFFLFAIIIACFYSVKMLLLKALGYILQIDKAVAVYVFNIFLINNILGIALIPVVAMLAYCTIAFSVYIVYAGVVLVILSFFYRMFRAFSISMSMSLGSLYYLFLYFCALEIAPILVILKFASAG